MRITTTLFFIFLLVQISRAQSASILASDSTFAKAFDINEYFNVDLAPEERQKIKDEIIKLTDVLEKHPNEYSIYINRGANFSYLGFHVNAIKDYDKALELKNDLPEAYYNRGLAKARFFYNVNSCKDIYAAANLGLVQAQTVFDKNCKRYTASIAGSK